MSRVLHIFSSVESTRRFSYGELFVVSLARAGTPQVIGKLTQQISPLSAVRCELFAFSASMYTCLLLFHHVQVAMCCGRGAALPPCCSKLSVSTFELSAVVQIAWQTFQTGEYPQRSYSIRIGLSNVICGPRSSWRGTDSCGRLIS